MTTTLYNSAGGAIVWRGQILAIRVRRDRWELPKGGIEPGESAREAAVREAVEESGLTADLRAGVELGALRYRFRDGRKQVRYFVLSPTCEPTLGPMPPGTRERRWIAPRDTAALPLVSESLRPIIERAFQ